MVNCHLGIRNFDKIWHMRIGLISDTHSFVEPAIYNHFAEVDEIWHAGDIGSIKVTDELQEFKPLRAVYGNIDGAEIRSVWPEHCRFNCEGMEVWITHIGGYPGRYSPKVKPEIYQNPPDLFICGHSHILKVVNDPKINCLHMNPGAIGNSGFHQVKTLLRFSVERGKVIDLDVIEIPRR